MFYLGTITANTQGLLLTPCWRVLNIRDAKRCNYFVKGETRIFWVQVNHFSTCSRKKFAVESISSLTLFSLRLGSNPRPSPSLIIFLKSHDGNDAYKLSNWEIFKPFSLVTNEISAVDPCCARSSFLDSGWAPRPMSSSGLLLICSNSHPTSLCMTIVLASSAC